MFSKHYAVHATNIKNKAGIKNPYINHMAGNSAQLIRNYGVGNLRWKPLPFEMFIVDLKVICADH